MKALVGISGFVALCLFGALAWLSFGRIMPATGGLQPLNFALLGYTVAEVQSYKDALTPQALALHTGLMHLLDSSFAIALALFLCSLLWSASRDQVVWVSMALILAPLGYGLMDLCENSLIKELLTAPSVVPETVRLASEFTVTKFVLLAGSLVLVLTTWARAARTAPAPA